MFESVNYTFYSTTMGRDVVPNEDMFDIYSLEAVTYMRRIVPGLKEREENAFDKAACMIVEELYKDAHTGLNGKIETSRSLDGFSQSFDISHVENIDSVKTKWVDAFCERRSW